MITRLVAPNPGPMTLDGTNTWLIGRDGRMIVVDPGPDDARHQQAIMDAAGAVELILLTHRHGDHSAGAEGLAARADCPIRARDAQLCRRGHALVDGEVITVAGIDLQVMATPGHTDDSVSFILPSGRALLSGDTVLGQGTTVITHPEGSLTAYLDSLDRLEAEIAGRKLQRILPGHGPEVRDPSTRIEQYRRHRMDRLQQVREARAAGARSIEAVLEIVYAGVDEAVLPAARQSVAAQLAHLDLIESRTDSAPARFRPGVIQARRDSGPA